jgi:hypothetical protein
MAAQPTLVLAGADLTGVSPSLANRGCAAAVLFGGVEGPWGHAASVLELSEAVALTEV